MTITNYQLLTHSLSPPKSYETNRESDDLPSERFAKHKLSRETKSIYNHSLYFRHETYNCLIRFCISSFYVIIRIMVLITLPFDVLIMNVYMKQLYNILDLYTV